MYQIDFNKYIGVSMTSLVTCMTSMCGFNHSMI